MSLLYPPVQPDETGCIHRPVLEFNRWRCGTSNCRLWLEPVLVAKEAMELRAVAEDVHVTEPVCDECGARHSDTDALYQVRGCVVDLESGVSAMSVARRMRRYLGMV